MLKIALPSLLLILIFNCAHDRNLDENLDKDINNRIEIINNGTEYRDTPVVSIGNIVQEVNNLILLSKDVENIKASINRSNTYFTENANKYRVETSGFIPLKIGMRLSEITDNIKRNELNLLNRIIIKRSKNGPPLFTAQ